MRSLFKREHINEIRLMPKQVEFALRFWPEELDSKQRDLLFDLIDAAIKLGDPRNKIRHEDGTAICSVRSR